MNRKHKIVLSTLISLYCINGHAEEKLDLQVSDIMVVKASDNIENKTLSKQIIDGKAIKSTPSANGNISEYLKSVPGVRVDNNSQTGFNNGEIKPQSISINGALPEQTAYMVDGINVNNDLDPTASLFDGIVSVNPNRSSEQAYFFDTNLLSNVTVYKNNVPAKLGGFTGGVVSAETKHYAGQNHFSANYRTNRSTWTKQHVDSAVKEKMNAAVPNGLDADFQPSYKKNFFNFTTEYGLTDAIGMTLGFGKRESKIKQTRMLNPDGDLDKRNHTRTSDNIFANFNWIANDKQTFEYETRYSNYKENKFYSTNINSNVKDSHLAYGSTLRFIQYLQNGKLTATTAYDKFRDKRDSNSAEAKIITDWDTGLDFEEGGFGDSQLTQENLNLLLDYQTDSLNIGSTEHMFNTGIEYRKTNFDFKRYQDVITGIYIRENGQDDLLYDEMIAHKGHIKTSSNNYVAYLQDDINLNNFTFKPGVRFERDNFLNNNNIAPRFSMDWQALSETKFNLGANRYYGRSFATMKLSRKVLRLSEDYINDYVPASDLNSPYSDELTFGVNQQWDNFLILANYTYRKYKQRIVIRQNIDDSGLKTNTFKNGDDFNTQVYSLEITNKEPWHLGNTLWKTTLGGDWLNTGRADLDRTLSPNDMVIYNGKPMTRAKMEKEINSGDEQWVVRLGLDMEIPSNDITWSNKVYIKAPIHSYIDTGSGTQQLPVYKEVDYGTHVQWDSRVRWQPKILSRHSLYVQADVLNVLNRVRKLDVGYSSNEYGIYTPGREFWLEVGYEF